ncbi:MAG TPA: DUF433 domain-containing protein [Tepidisphaeraceae bacterium]|jgi:uncharacterized protein (DUF433 family)|nr:DUF433 domain-containing protein [Tepidisphaeraceae bacterium]
MPPVPDQNPGPIPYADLLELLAAGASHEEILADYAFLEPADVHAALLYAARLLDHPIVPAA